MTDDLEREVRAALRRPLPAAPPSLREAVADLPSRPVVRERGSRRVAISILAAAVVVIVVVASFVRLGGPSGIGADPSASPAPSTSVAPSPPSSAPPSAAASGDASVTVSQFLDALPDRSLGSSDLLVRGYWTDRTFPHSCAPPDEEPGELELRCIDGEWGITEREEPIGELTRVSRWIPAEGPAITPYFDFEDEAVIPLFTLPVIREQRYPPVPIVVRGHIDDSRAADCRPDAELLCLDRLVVDEIVSFQPDAVPTPGITPSPSPFPVDDPPPEPFTKQQCSGDVEYSFIGWGRLADIGVDVGDPDEIVFMMVTAGEVDLGDPGGPRGRRVCYAHEWEHGSVSFAPVP